MTNVANEPANVQNQLLGDWQAYLDRIRESSELRVGIAETVRDVWTELTRRIPGLDPPHAAPTEDGELIMVWDRGHNHFEVEITTRDKYEWFYRDRQTDTYAGEDGCRVGDYSEDFRSTLGKVWTDLMLREDVFFNSIP